MIVYLTTNLINNKKYIGIDTNNDSSYLGSGIFLKKAIKKYGVNNFKKEVLEICENREILLEKEKEWIIKFNAVNSKEFYNIHEGGIGGDIRIFMNENEIKEWSNNISEGKKGLKKGIPLSEKNKEGISKGLKEYYGNGGIHNRTGKKLSEETKQKISKSNTGKIFSEDHRNNLKESFKKRDYNGEKNPFFGQGDKISGEKNPMYGKSFYDIWVEKYGKEVADEKLKVWKENKKKKPK